MQLKFRHFLECLYLLAYSVTLVQSTRQRPDHFLIGNASLSVNSTQEEGDGPFEYKGIKGGPTCTVEGSNVSQSPEIQVYIRHDNIRSLAFGGGYAEHSSVYCKGEVENFCTAWTMDSRPRQTDRSCLALVEECSCEPDIRISSKAHLRVVKEVRHMCYKAPDQRDLYTDPFRILIIGLSSGVLPMYLMADCRVFVPGGLKLSIVEPDPRVVDLAHDLFGFAASSSVAEIETVDPKKALLERLLEPDHVKYDVVIVDLTDGSGGIPESVQGTAFLEGLDRLLRPGSQVMHYVPSSAYNQTFSDYVTVFGKEYLQEYETGMSREEGPEHIIVVHGPPILTKSSTWLPTVGKGLLIITLYAMAQL
eukprot:gnl/MRDRNA2_/MRDRNA2_113265_c0_seq1.p1 gnl/MRDRNA2_/MRDRNA2_113265_c0~~gnl/MRDRNA2_/MRDRNA2_113265_c0_seq1.p1  ORF type:complete len:363 (+),score=44.29 gnl/MRDRNA2_/MRDRNA2_113265_c0_seq1:184-1272(+)